MQPSKAEPRFDLDLPYGKQGELQVAEFLDWIARGNGRVEVKRKRYMDLWFYVEFECDKGRTGRYVPSGIAVTTAEAWAFVIAETGISVVLPTERLRQVIAEREWTIKEETHGNCPTRGYFVPLQYLVSVQHP